MAKSMFEEAEEKGIEKGVLQALRRANRRLLTERFGPLGQTTIDRIEALPERELDELLPRILSAPSLAALGLE
jgi:hypothetical protein